MGQDGQRFACALLCLQAGQKLLSVGIVPQEQRGRFGKGPREVRVADVLARSAQAFARRFLAACDQARVRGKSLYAGKAAEVVNVREQDEAEELADPGAGLSQIQRVGVMVFGRLDDRECDVAQQCIVLGDERQVALDGLVHGRVVKALSAPLPVRVVSDFLADVGHVVGRVGIGPMREECCTLAHQRRAPPQEVTGGPHLGRRDRGLGEQPPSEQSGNLLGIALGVFGLAAMDGFHGEGVSQDKGDFLGSAEIGESIPGAHTFDRYDETLTRGSHSREERFRSGFHIAV